MMKGPYTTARRVYTSFSSHCRPNVSLVQKSMQQLQDAGLGVFRVENKLKIFYKALPSDDLQPKLAKYNVSLEEYRRLFLKKTTSLPPVTSKPFQRITHFLNNLMPYLKKNSCRGYYRKSQSITVAIRGSLQNQFTKKNNRLRKKWNTSCDCF